MIKIIVLLKLSKAALIITQLMIDYKQIMSRFTFILLD
jgi:hypothetical protein